ncbi:MAG: CbtB domain-containing protein [Acidobacteriota bacterium]
MEALHTAWNPARTRALAIRWPALGVFVLGVALVYCAGFSTLSQAHNATHDTRHANGFPCH